MHLTEIYILVPGKKRLTYLGKKIIIMELCIFIILWTHFELCFFFHFLNKSTIYILFGCEFQIYDVSQLVHHKKKIFVSIYFLFLVLKSHIWLHFKKRFWHLFLFCFLAQLNKTHHLTFRTYTFHYLQFISKKNYNTINFDTFLNTITIK